MEYSVKKERKEGMKKRIFGILAALLLMVQVP